MEFNLKILEELNPCTKGFNNFKKHYPKYKGTVQEVMTLSKIPYNHKLWLADKMLDAKTLNQLMVECTENLIDSKTDERIINLIKVVKKLHFNLERDEIYKASELVRSPTVEWMYSKNFPSARTWTLHMLAHNMGWSHYFSKNLNEKATTQFFRGLGSKNIYCPNQRNINLSILIDLINNL